MNIIDFPLSNLMKPIAFLLILIIMILPNTSVHAQARTHTEFGAYAGQYTYNKTTGEIEGRYYKNYHERNLHNSEQYMCVFNNATDEIGYEYVIHTSGYTTQSMIDGYRLYEPVKCRKTDGYDNILKSELKAYAQKIKARNLGLSYKSNIKR